ncbi:MAG: hypothetical protein FWH29_05405 [Methanobrevibacter sp.]|nr:hypothetical protein [Methanobrevibacter sp.]
MEDNDGSSLIEGLFLFSQGKFLEASKFFKEAEEICRKLNDNKQLSFIMRFQADCLMNEGKLKEAMELHKEAGQMFKKLHDNEGLEGCLDSQAKILGQQGKLEQSIDCLREREKICKKIGDKECLAFSLFNQGEALFFLGDTSGILLMEKALAIANENGFSDAVSLFTKSMKANSIEIKNNKSKWKFW